MKATEADELQAARAAARSRVLKEFEHAQTGLSSKPTAGKLLTSSASTSTVVGGNGLKRKFDLDEEEIDRLAQEGEEEALKRIEVEMAESRRAKLPNFWLVSVVLIPLVHLKDSELTVMTI